MSDGTPDAQPRRRLGRGLSSLLGQQPMADAETTAPHGRAELIEVRVDAIRRNPWQPRKTFETESLRELAGSIREHGVLQPLIVRELDEQGFQLIAGERRWQAARQAGLATVPCRVVDVIDQTACEYALEENLKREDLNDLEKAQAFRQYLDQFGTTVEELAKQLSMSRPAISNMLRLLELPESIRQALHAGKITAGHARALLPLPHEQQLAMCEQIQREALSVRRTEAAVRAALQPPVETLPLAQPEPPSPAAHNNHVRSLEEQLRKLLGVKVEIRLKGNHKGQIIVPFATNDEFEHVLRQLRRQAA